MTDKVRNQVWFNEVKENKKKFHFLIRHLSDIAAFLDQDGNISYITLNIYSMTNLQEGNVLGNSIFHFAHEEDLSSLKNAFHQALASRGIPISTRTGFNFNEKGWSSYEVTLINLLHENNVNEIVMNLKDLNEYIQIKKHVSELTYLDKLTMLPNRRLFESKLRNELEKASRKKQKVGVLLLDIHGLYHVNNVLSINMGDGLLTEAAMRVKSLVKDMGFLARIDGVEFAIILPNIETKQASAIAEKIIDLFSLPFSIKNYELYLTINIGISCFAEDAQSLIREASSALNNSTILGKNQYMVFTADMLESAYRRFILKNDLRNALKIEEFFLCFQPRIDTKTNKILGIEALVRWEHPKLGVVSPMEFIPIAEEDGLIGPLGEFVLHQACQQNKRWQDAGFPPVEVSVNFSVIQFLQSDIIETVDRTLRKTKLEPKWLEIEITETALLENHYISKIINELMSKGVKIAIDDFGTGYASLSYLKDLRANSIKIDKSFIDGIALELKSSHIVSSIIQLAQKLGVRTVAEGVETIEQLNILKDFQCDQIQGYLYSRPLKKEDIGNLLKQEFCMPTQSV